MYVTQCLFCLALACQRRFFLYFLHFFFHTIAPKVRENVYNQNSSLIEMNWFRVATTSTFHFDHLKLYTWQLSVFVLSIRALSLRFFFCFALHCSVYGMIFFCLQKKFLVLFIFYMFMNTFVQNEQEKKNSLLLFSWWCVWYGGRWRWFTADALNSWTDNFFFRISWLNNVLFLFFLFPFNLFVHRLQS